MNPAEHELLATVGTIKGIRGKIFCLTAYALPNLTLLKVRQMHEYTSVVIDEAKRLYPDCTITLAGDFNHWPIEEATEDHVDMAEVTHSCTRGSRSIDRSFVNFSRAIVESGTLPPLETEDGRFSDHRIAFAKAVFHKPKPPTVTYSYRHYTDQGASRFGDLIAEQTWESVRSAVGPSDKAAAFQIILDTLMAACFVMKTTTKRTTDTPWVNSKRKKAVKKAQKGVQQGRTLSQVEVTKKQCKDLYTKRAAAYMNEQKKVLTAPDASRAFFKNVKAYKCKEKPPSLMYTTCTPEVLTTK